MTDGDGTRVRSAVDLWYVGLIALALLAIIVAAPSALPGDRLIALVLLAPLLAFPGSLLLATWYELRNEYLYCRSGPFVERIPYKRIRSLRLCENLWSSMALSRHRIEIRQHGRGWITGTTYISPVDREGFLEELQERCASMVTHSV